MQIHVPAAERHEQVRLPFGAPRVNLLPAPDRNVSASDGHARAQAAEASRAARREGGEP